MFTLIRRSAAAQLLKEHHPKPRKSWGAIDNQEVR